MSGPTSFFIAFYKRARNPSARRVSRKPAKEHAGPAATSTEGESAYASSNNANNRAETSGTWKRLDGATLTGEREREHTRAPRHLLTRRVERDCYSVSVRQRDESSPPLDSAPTAAVEGTRKDSKIPRLWPCYEITTSIGKFENACGSYITAVREALGGIQEFRNSGV